MRRRGRKQLSTKRVEIFGQPSAAVMEGMKRLASIGAEITVTPRLAGFDRFAAPVAADMAE